MVEAFAGFPFVNNQLSLKVTVSRYANKRLPETKIIAKIKNEDLKYFVFIFDGFLNIISLMQDMQF